MADLHIQGLHKYYGQNHVVKGIDLVIPSGEFTVLVGQSGCGKSTLLRTIAGLEFADQGSIAIADQRVGEAREVDQTVPIGVVAGEPRHLDDAVRVYRRILEEFDPQNETAQIVLERLYGQQQRWPELFAVYERQLASAAGEYEQGEVSAKMARVAMAGLGDIRRAIDLWKRVLELKGDDGEALGAIVETIRVQYA